MKLAEKRIAEALQVLRELGMPREQLNDRTAICLIALLNIPPKKKWAEAETPMLGIRDILDFARGQLNVKYAENTRESIRKYSVKQMVAAGVLLHNPDKPDRPVNSSDNCYQVDVEALELLRQYGSRKWVDALPVYLSKRGALAKQYAREREKHRVPVRINKNKKITLSPGLHSDLIKSIIEDFAATYVHDADLVYVGDTGTKWGFFNEELLVSLGVRVEQHGKMPDVVLYDGKRKWLVLVEAVASSGPVDSGRHLELEKLFRKSKAGLVFVTAFPDRGEVFRKFLSVVAWETEVWCASDPTHLIHFNGERFLGPYEK